MKINIPVFYFYFFEKDKKKNPRSHALIKKSGKFSVLQSRILEHFHVTKAIFFALINF